MVASIFWGTLKPKFSALQASPMLQCLYRSRLKAHCLGGGLTTTSRIRHGKFIVRFWQLRENNDMVDTTMNYWFCFVP